MKRFRIGELINYRPLECYGTITTKGIKDGKRFIGIKLHDNIEGKTHIEVYELFDTIEHLSE